MGGAFLKRNLAPLMNLFTPIVATGGSISDVEIDGVNYRIHEFTSTGTSTFTVTDVGTNSEIDYLIVAGGGGSGRYGPGGGGGGGGAGGLLTSFDSTKFVPTITSYSINVGDGGNEEQEPGGNSSAFGFTAIGGGAGDAEDSKPSTRDGGSGAGPSMTGSDFRTNGQAIAGNQGKDGGNSASNVAAGDRAGAGGGGYNQVGGNSSYRNAGDGGDGRDMSQFFTNNYGDNGYFSGGGGGGGASDVPSSNRGIGGLGGGGNGVVAGVGVGGQTNTGGGAGGGGGDGNLSGDGSKGGSGIVLIRYRLDPPS